MFDTLKYKIAQWLMRGVRDEGIPVKLVSMADVVSTQNQQSITPTRIGITQALNGRILEISTYKHNPHGPDWTNEYFLVHEGEALSEAITMMLIAKNIK